MPGVDYNFGVTYAPSDSAEIYSGLDLSNLGSEIQYIRLQWVDYINNVRYRVIPRSYFQRLLRSNRPGVTMTVCVLGDVMRRLAPSFEPNAEYLCVADIRTLRICPYTAGHATVMSYFQEKTLVPRGSLTLPLCPRTILKRIVDEAEAKIGLRFLLGIESEFVLLSATSPKPISVNDAGWCCSAKLPCGAVETTVMHEIAEHLQKAQIEVQQYHGEVAPGQYEVVTGPLTPLEAADALVHTRDIIYNVAHKHGLRATFAPRVDKNSCGSASHTHVSMHTSRPVPASDHDGSFAPMLTSTERSFLQGLLTHLPAICALTLPTTFSYARVVDGIRSGGTYVCWGTDNREAPVRLCGSEGEHRFEVRCVDGTANPYLVLAAIIAAGVEGVVESARLTSRNCNTKAVAKMTLEERRKYGLENATRLPQSLEEARKALREDVTMRRLLGEEFVEKYLIVNETLEKSLQADTEETTLSKLVEFY